MAASFTGDIFRWKFVKENVLIQVKISLKFVPRDPIDNKSSLVQVMAWRRIGDKPLHEPMTTQFNDTYIDELTQYILQYGCNLLRIDQMIRQICHFFPVWLIPTRWLNVKET